MADMNQTQSELLKILDSHDLLRTHHMEKASGSGENFINRSTI